MRPYAPSAVAGTCVSDTVGGTGPTFAILSKPRRRNVGTASGIRFAMFPTVSLP